MSRDAQRSALLNAPLRLAAHRFMKEIFGMEVRAYHVVMSFYGFWLPNDERGSGSWYVGSKALYPFGPATHIDSQCSVAHRPHNKALRLEARKNLKYPVVVINGLQARAIARGFASFVAKSGLLCYACAILPDDVHLVVERFRYSIEKVMIKLKSAATMELVSEGFHPFQQITLPNGQHPNIFGRDGRHVFLFTADDIRGRIKYVRNNPVKAGLPQQTWSFVVPFRG